MHTVIITFNLVDMTRSRYREVCAELAPAFAELPGLLAKLWLCDEHAGGFGGIYLFERAESADTFLASALYRTVRSFSHFTDIAVRRYEVDEATTRRTQPGLAVVGSAPVTV